MVNLIFKEPFTKACRFITKRAAIHEFNNSVKQTLNSDNCQSIPGWLKAIIQSIYHPGAASVISLKKLSYLLLNQVFKVVVSTPSQDLSGVTLITRTI